MSLSARPCLIRLEAKPSAVTEALRRHVDRYRSRFEFDPERMHVLNRLLACRTAKLGTHLCVCDACGWKAPVYNPCRNRHCPQRLDARLGITAVLHTWTSELTYHPHVHCIVTAGALHRDDARWVATRDD